MDDVRSVLEDAKKRMKKAVEVLESEYNHVRTGRANASLVSGLKVNYYGAPTPLSQMANIAVTDARTIAIRPWDPTAIKDIEKAILASDLGITPSNDGKVIRLTVPPLTGERRKALANQVNEMAEKARVSIRNIRREAIKKCEELKKNSVITEDDLERAKKDIQELTSDHEKMVNEVLEKKRKEIMEV